MENKEESIDKEKKEDEAIFLDYLIVLAKHKKLILSIALPVIVIALIAAMFYRSFYKAQTLILSSQQQDVSLAKQYINQFGGMFGSSGINNHFNLLRQLMKSRTITDRLIQRFDLMNHYGKKDITKIRKKLSDNMTITESRSGNKAFSMLNSTSSDAIIISVFDRDPVIAANMANAIVEELNTLIRSIAISEASQRRLFFEKQLKHISDALLESEEEVKQFQEKTGILVVEGKINIPIDKFAPALMLEYKRIFRQLKFNETLYEIVVKQYEAAKWDEAKDTAIIQVVDKAVPPEKKGKHRIIGFSKAFVLIILSFFFSCFLAFFMEFKERSEANSEYIERIQTLKNYLSFKKDR